MAEIEFSVLTRACLQGRNPDETALQRAINAYEAERNAARATITTEPVRPTPRMPEIRLQIASPELEVAALDPLAIPVTLI